MNRWFPEETMLQNIVLYETTSGGSGALGLGLTLLYIHSAHLREHHIDSHAYIHMYTQVCLQTGVRTVWELVGG